MNIAIAVPVRDEERGLPHLLTALAAQEGVEQAMLSIYLLFDGCTDRGVEIAKAFFERHPNRGGWSVIERQTEPSAGRARRAAADAVLRHCEFNPPDIVLTSDADTVPDRDWIASAADDLRHVDVVAGYTARDTATSLPARDALEDYLERLHALRRRIDPLDYDPAPSHPWVGGANLGIRLSAYRQLGGFRELESGEDRDLVDRARHDGLRVRHSRRMRVRTSSRLEGRARGGLADALRHMASEVGEPQVEHPFDAARQYGRHALARRAFFVRDDTELDWIRLGSSIGTPAEALRTIAGRAANAEAFVMKAVPVHPTSRSLPLSKASNMLDTLTPEQFHE